MVQTRRERHSAFKGIKIGQNLNIFIEVQRQLCERITVFQFSRFNINKMTITVFARLGMSLISNKFNLNHVSLGLHRQMA